MVTLAHPKHAPPPLKQHLDRFSTLLCSTVAAVETGAEAGSCVDRITKGASMGLCTALPAVSPARPQRPNPEEKAQASLGDRRS